jgi:hypothetical protein
MFNKCQKILFERHGHHLTMEMIYLAVEIRKALIDEGINPDEPCVGVIDCYGDRQCCKHCAR